MLKNCPLFADIAEDQLAQLLVCLSAKRQTYQKDAFIFRVQEPAVHVGIVLSGGANVIQEDFWGSRAILTHAAPGELFGEAFACAGEGAKRLPVSVIAAEASEILLVDYRKIVTVCSSACGFHARLISNMLQILAEKNIMLTRKMEYLSKRSLRAKLLAYLSSQAVRAGKNTVEIPFDRQELADYLGAERSALSRELGSMKRDGLLDYKKNKFTLFSLDKSEEMEYN